MSKIPTVEERAQQMRDEHLQQRDAYMRKARQWRQYAFDRDDIGALFQAEDFVKAARRSNHHAVALIPWLTA